MLKKRISLRDEKWSCSLRLSIQETNLLKIMDAFPQGDFNITGSWTLHVPVHRGKLKLAIQRVLQKDPSLRMRFIVNESGNYIKTINPVANIMLETLVPEKIEIDSSQGQIVRCFLTDDNRFVVSVHHLVADGRSAARLVIDILREYSLQTAQSFIDRFSSLSVLHSRQTPTTQDYTRYSLLQENAVQNDEFSTHVDQLFDSLNAETYVPEVSPSSVSFDLPSSQLARIRHAHVKVSDTNIMLYLVGMAIKSLTGQTLLARVLRSSKSLLTDYSATSFPATITGTSIGECHTEAFKQRVLLKSLGVFDVIPLEKLLEVYNREKESPLSAFFEVNVLSPLMSSPPAPVLSQAILDLLPVTSLKSNGYVNLGVWHDANSSSSIYGPKVTCTVHVKGDHYQIDLMSLDKAIPAQDLRAKILDILESELSALPVLKSRSSQKYLAYSTLGVLGLSAFYYARR